MMSSGKSFVNMFAGEKAALQKTRKSKNEDVIGPRSNDLLQSSIDSRFTSPGQSNPYSFMKQVSTNQKNHTLLGSPSANNQWLSDRR